MRVEHIFFFLIFLFPLATYLTLLATINRKENPVVVPGVWDAVGLLFASSGFLLAAGPSMLSALYGRGTRALLTQGDDGPLLDLWNSWGILWGLYYGAVACAALFLILSRRQTTVVYNVEPAVFDAALTQALENLGLAWARLGNRVFLRQQAAAAAPAPPADEHIQAGTGPLPRGNVEEAPAAPPVGPFHPASLRVEPFPAFYNVTVHWHGLDADLRDTIENELRMTLANAYTRHNPVGGWLLGLSGTLFAVMFVTVLFLLFAILVLGVR